MLFMAQRLPVALRREYRILVGGSEPSGKGLTVGWTLHVPSIARVGHPDPTLLGQIWEMHVPRERSWAASERFLSHVIENCEKNGGQPTRRARRTDQGLLDEMLKVALGKLK